KSPPARLSGAPCQIARLNITKALRYHPAPCCWGLFGGAYYVAGWNGVHRDNGGSVRGAYRWADSRATTAGHRTRGRPWRVTRGGVPGLLPRAVNLLLVAAIVAMTVTFAGPDRTAAAATPPIAFQRNGDIWKINADGSGTTNLTNFSTFQQACCL